MNMIKTQGRCGTDRTIRITVIAVLLLASIASVVSASTVTYTWKFDKYAIGQDATGSAYESNAPTMPDIIKLPDNSYRMYYGVLLSPAFSGATSAIKSATSTDGISWTVESGYRLLGYGYTGQSGIPVNEGVITGPSVVRLANGTYRMYYQASTQGITTPPDLRVKSATSSDGITWTREGTRIDINYPYGSATEFSLAGHCNVIRFADNDYAIQLSGNYGANSSTRPSNLVIGTSNDGLTFSNFFDLYTNGHDPYVLKLADGSGYRLFYGNLLERQRTAFSTDGKNWPADSQTTETVLLNSAGSEVTEASPEIPGDRTALELSSGEILLFVNWRATSSDIALMRQQFVTPVANFAGTPTSGTAPLTVTFTDSSTNTPASWSWNFGDSSSVNATVKNPVHTYANAGTYTVALTATNSAGSNVCTKTNYIAVSSGVVAPVANFTGTPTSGTAPLTVQFTDSSTNTPTSWSWSFGDSSSVNATMKNPVHTYASASTYTVKLTATNSAGSNTKSNTNYITVSSAVITPVANFAGTPTSGTAPLTVTFTDSSTNTPTAWSWNFGDSSSVNATVKNPVHTYASAGTYTVALTATNAAGSDTKTVNNYITVTSGKGDNTIIGFRWDTSDPSPRLYQIDSTGSIIANKDATFWDNWNVTGNMKTVVVNATNTTVVLYGTNNRGDGLDLTGSSGDVMVEIPRFYTCSTYANGNFSYWISPLPAPGFTVAPMFNQRGTGTAAGTPAPCYYVGRYDASLVGNKLQSATGKAPGGSMIIGAARTYAENKGAGWGITSIWTLSGLRQLFYTEMLTLDSQTAWAKSRGVVDYSPSNGPKNSGADFIDTQISANNATGSGTGTNGFTPVSYRGIENLWGNVWQFQDGFNAIQGTTNVINSTGLGVTGQKTSFKDLLDATDVQSVGALVLTDGYQKNLMNTDVARPLFQPSAVGGLDTTYLSDYYYYPRSTNPGTPNILLSGGRWFSAGDAGVGYLRASIAASYSSASLGARLEFRQSTAPGAPEVSGITPSTGVNTGTVSITNLAGTGFLTGAMVKLTRTGQTDIAATGVSVVSATQITCTVDLTGKATGQWNIVVTNPDSQTGTLTNGFTVTSLAPPAPVANFTGSPTSGTAPLTVTFTDTSANTPTGWAWFFGDETYTQAWTLVNASAGWTPRMRHTSVVMPDGSIVLMGGQDNDGYKNDTWWSTDKSTTWTLVNASSGWTPRMQHTSVVTPDGSIVLSGGHDGSARNDVWRSSDKGTTWTQVNASAGWAGRYEHSSVALPDGSIVLMGGWISPGYKNDTWRSTDNGATWTQVNPSSGWSARGLQTSVALPDGSIVLSGGGSVRFRNDTWQSTDGGATWMQVNASSGWSARVEHSSVALPDGSILLLGGYDGSHKNDTWRSTDNGATWTQVNPSSGWSARVEHRVVAMPDGSIVLMGGYDNADNFKNDVWRCNPVGSSAQNPSHTYANIGTYTVSLTATNAAGSNTKTVADYITVTAVSGIDTVGVFRNGSFYLKDATAFGYGLTGDFPIAGDWLGSGVDTGGVFRNGSFYLKDGPSFSYGLTGDKPVAGDWKGEGKTGVGVFRGGMFFLRDSTTGGTYAYFSYGQANDYPIAGDWDGDGLSEAGVFRDGVFYLRASNGTTYDAFGWGLTGDSPIAGDWDGDGKTEVGVFRNGSFYLRSSTGTTYDQFGYGLTGDFPIAGKWV